MNSRASPVPGGSSGWSEASRKQVHTDTTVVSSNSMALTVRTDRALEEALSSLAASEGTSRQEVIRRAVLDRYERSAHVERVGAAVSQMVERWGDVLDRLGTE